MFQKGQSGNPGGRRKEKVWRNAIERAIKRSSKEGMQVVDELADALIQAALEKDVSALKEIGDRLDGKVPQALIGGDEDDAPVSLQVIELRAVYPKDETGG